MESCRPMVVCFAALLLFCLTSYCNGAQNPFRNPLAVGADPSVARVGDQYYVLWTRGRDFSIHVVSSLNDLEEAQPHTVWCAKHDGFKGSYMGSPELSFIDGSLWAPELHFVDGSWHIYGSGSVPGSKYRFELFALRSINATNPLGPYRWLGWMAPGANAIDPTVFSWRGKLYFMWSQIDPHPTNDWQQCIYIAPARNSGMAGYPRRRLSCAEHNWEMVGAPINEGPVVLQHGGRLFLVFSAGGAITPDYSLGLMEYTGGNILDPSSWRKLPKPVLRRADASKAWGPGHNSFVTDPDGRWIMLYHVKQTTNETFLDRVLYAQYFDFGEDGLPIFQAPEAATRTEPLGPTKPGSTCPLALYLDPLPDDSRASYSPIAVAVGVVVGLMAVIAAIVGLLSYSSRASQKARLLQFQQDLDRKPSVGDKDCDGGVEIGAGPGSALLCQDAGQGENAGAKSNPDKAATQVHLEVIAQ